VRLCFTAGPSLWDSILDAHENLLLVFRAAAFDLLNSSPLLALLDERC
jgi:hypothetical protein